MSRSYYDQKAETAALAETLMRRPGWAVTGYKEDKSEIQSDYFDPAYWHGDAVFVPTGHRLVTRFAGAKEVPNGKSWALLDRDGKRVACGVNVKRSGSSLRENRYRVDLVLLAEKLETLAGRPPKASAARLRALAETAEDWRIIWSWFDWSFPSEADLARASAEDKAKYPRLKAVADRFFADRFAGATEQERRKTAALCARDRANRMSDAVRRRLADFQVGRLAVVG